MTTSQPLRYLPTMFATCMLFMVLYVLCVASWVVFPDLKGHAILTELLPQFEFLDVVSFIYGLIMMAIYGWLVAAVFVFFHNLWPVFARVISSSSNAK
jgi:hypothetical protein